MAKTNQTEPVTRSVPRAYDHKTHGHIGDVTLVVTGGTFALNGTELPETSVEHLLTFALQSLQDAYAGAENGPDAVARFNAKLERLLEGSIGVRVGTGVSALQAAIRQVLRPLVKDAVGAAAWKELEEDARVATIDAAFDGLSDDDKAKVTERANEVMAEKKAEAERAKAATAGITVKLG